MAPLPKRKHSTQRKGKRMAERIRSMPKLVICTNCKRKKKAHNTCKYCGK